MEHDKEWYDCKEVFTEAFEKHADNFVETLKWKKGTKSKYSELLFWLNYHLEYTEHISIEQIKPGDLGTKFYNHCRYNYDFEPNYKKRLLEFFLYLKEEGYENEKVINYLSKK